MFLALEIFRSENAKSAKIIEIFLFDFFFFVPNLDFYDRDRSEAKGFKFWQKTEPKKVLNVPCFRSLLAPKMPFLKIWTHPGFQTSFSYIRAEFIFLFKVSMCFFIFVLEHSNKSQSICSTKWKPVGPESLKSVLVLTLLDRQIHLSSSFST